MKSAASASFQSAAELPDRDDEQALPRKRAVASKPMDEALRLAAKIDRLLDKMPPWAKEWAVKYIIAKYGTETPSEY